MRLSSQGLAAPSPSHSAPWDVVSWLYTSAGFPTYFRMCVWQYRRGKDWSDMPVKALYLFCIDIISWRIPTRTPNKAHLAANRNDDFFFFSTKFCLYWRKIATALPPRPHGSLPAFSPHLEVCCKVSCFPSKEKNSALLLCPLCL